MGKVGSGGAEGIGDGGEAPVSGGVAVNEEVIWKARAQEAEEKAAGLETRVQELEQSLARARETIAHVERRGEIDRELTAAKTIDLETARLLTEATIGEMDEPDIAVAVRELCDRKPFLFACRDGGVHVGASMSPSVGSGVEDESGVLARRARSSGDRSELLRYLRVRRGM